MKIYTRTGDDGTSGLYSGQRLPKSDIRFETVGTIDELNAAVGLARASLPAGEVDCLLRSVQELLFELGADIATLRSEPSRIGSEDVRWLEAAIDRMTGQLPELRTFLLPTGHPAAAALHCARGICRRAERLVVRAGEESCVPASSAVFLNRLSDFLFTIARFQNHLSGVSEDPWLPAR